MKLTFHGAARTVTGSRHLLEAGGRRVLVDCGMFQGNKSVRALNFEPFPFAAAAVAWLAGCCVSDSRYILKTAGSISISPPS